MGIDWYRILGSVLLVVLVFGMSATVDINSLRNQLKNTRALGTCLFFQFLLLPFMGFLTVKLLDLDHSTGIILLVVCSSPGGSYSNWTCSMFNADLALSVTATAISTCLSVVLLPFNLVMYSNWAYGDDLSNAIDWSSLAQALLLVICAVAAGLYASAQSHGHDFNLKANRWGNYAGLVLIIFSAILSSSNKDARIWNREPSFYFGVAAPCILALLSANFVSLFLNLPKPEVVAIAVESCYQNVGIAMSVAIAMFNGEDLARGVAVPFYYGLLQAFFAFCYCTMAWKLDWTKAPSNVSFWKMLTTSYEILAMETDVEEIETDGYVHVEETQKVSTV